VTKPCELCGAVTAVLIDGWDGTWPCACGKWPGHAVCHACLKEWGMGPAGGRLAVCVDEARLARDLMAAPEAPAEKVVAVPRRARARWSVSKEKVRLDQMTAAEKAELERGIMDSLARQVQEDQWEAERAAREAAREVRRAADEARRRGVRGL